MSKIEAANLTFVLSAVALLFAVYAVGEARKLIACARAYREEAKAFHDKARAYMVEARADWDDAVRQVDEASALRREVWEVAQEIRAQNPM